MPHTDVREKTEVWVALRKHDYVQSCETLNLVDLLERLLTEMGDTDVRVTEVLAQLHKLKEPDGGFERYSIQGIATTREIAISMCRDASYLIGPLPVNVALPHDRSDWPGLHFPLEGQ